MLRILCMIMGLILFPIMGNAQAASVTMDRNTESDMAWYRAQHCNTSTTCIPNTPKSSLDIPQPLIGNPTKVIPATESGRLCYKAEDVVGNQSPCSNTIPFRGVPLLAPSGLVQTP
jgi:hypothetical protein